MYYKNFFTLLVIFVMPNLLMHYAMHGMDHTDPEDIAAYEKLAPLLEDAQLLPYYIIDRDMYDCATSIMKLCTMKNVLFSGTENCIKGRIERFAVESSPLLHQALCFVYATCVVDQHGITNNKLSKKAIDDTVTTLENNLRMSWASTWHYKQHVQNEIDIMKFRFQYEALKNPQVPSLKFLCAWQLFKKNSRFEIDFYSDQEPPQVMLTEDEDIPMVAPEIPMWKSDLVMWDGEPVWISDTSPLPTKKPVLETVSVQPDQLHRLHNSVHRLPLSLKKSCLKVLCSDMHILTPTDTYYIYDVFKQLPNYTTALLYMTYNNTMHNKQYFEWQSLSTVHKKNGAAFLDCFFAPNTAIVPVLQKALDDSIRI